MRRVMGALTTEGRAFCDRRLRAAREQRGCENGHGVNQPHPSNVAYRQDRDWIPLFDEAHALFGKRAETRDAHEEDWGHPESAGENGME